jgi:hypothetical protein
VLGFGLGQKKNLLRQLHLCTMLLRLLVPTESRPWIRIASRMDTYVAPGRGPQDPESTWMMAGWPHPRVGGPTAVDPPDDQTFLLGTRPYRAPLARLLVRTVLGTVQVHVYGLLHVAIRRSIAVVYTRMMTGSRLGRPGRPGSTALAARRRRRTAASDATRTLRAAPGAARHGRPYGGRSPASRRTRALAF